MYIHDISRYKDVYDKHKNLKLAAEELGMKWQTLYWHLKEEGHPVTGDKERYGSPTDKMAKYLEDVFQEWLPHSIDCNANKFQAKVDFKVGGYTVDIKSSTKKDGYKNNHKKNPALRWAFSTKVQEDLSDFLICFCMEGVDCTEYGEIEKILLIPSEFYKNKQSISVSCNKSKWWDFEVTKKELVEFFKVK
ncbi:hypothetical protein NVP1063O_065 [Vibrio phage 1.063.O._10N.261.45.C7]|nr:hypothetical protein NVP1063O_065 [Vibrio phage 1.063.O._10N.261.45.C7]